MAHVRLAMAEGFDQVVYPRDRDRYGMDEVVAVRGRREAEQFAVFLGDWCVQPIGDFLGTLLQVRTNRVLPQIIETGFYYHNQKTGR